MSTVEAIQASLPGLGVILYPGSASRFPERIYDSNIRELELKVFPKPNSRGRIYVYKRNEPLFCWDFDYAYA